MITNIITSMSHYPRLLVGLQESSETERRARLRNLCRTDLYFLLRYTLNRADIEHDWLFARCREVEANPNGYLDLWAREHYKSTIITFGKTIQDILASHGEDPLPEWEGREVTVGLFSHTRPIAKRFLRQIKVEFETNQTLKNLFPDVLWANPHKESSKWSEDDGIVVKRRSNPGEATVEAWGLVDGQPIGKHFVVLVYDDVVVRESVNTPDMIEKTTEMLRLSYNLGSDGGHRRFIGTRYHFNDSYRTIMDSKSAIPRIYPATADGQTTGEPVLYTEKTLEQKRRDMGPYVFGTQMMLNPKADEQHGFKREWLRHYDNIHEGRGLNKYLLVDPANSKKKNNDYTAIWVIGLGPDENYYALEIIRDRLSLSQRTTRVMNLHRKWKPLDVRYEEYGLQADISHIKTIQESEQYRFEITPVAGKTSKFDRISRLIPLFEQGKIYLPRSWNTTDYQGKVQDMVHEFIETEYMAFPVPIHDDMLDGLARISEPDLTLKWPAKQKPKPPIKAWRPRDRAMGS